MDAIEHRLSAWDGLKLRALEWPGTDPGKRAVLGLPGLVRTADDFRGPAEGCAAGRRLVAIDYPGRGGSGRARAGVRYAPEACLRDVMDVCAALHLRRAAVLGTSFGGLLAMGLAAARPGLVGAVVLNDVGPAIGEGGADFVRRFVGRDPALPDLAAAVAMLRRELPPLSLASEADWQEMARLTYAPGIDGRWHPVWDTRIARLLDGPAPDLWPLFGGLAHAPLLLVRGALSDILLPATVRRMQKTRPDMDVITLDGVGHAPTLNEPEIAAAIRDFLAAADG